MSDPIIIHHEPEWLAVDKPSGMTVHNADSSNPEDDLLGSLARLLGVSKSSLHPVNRLDRETSGLILIARHSESARTLQGLFAERDSSLVKTYRAIVHGRVTPAKGEWIWELTDKAEGRDFPQGAKADRKPAQTNYTVLRENAYFSDLEVRLHTGRQHQIRRHCALAKNLIAGDSRYGDARSRKTLVRLFAIDRMLLHAHRLQFKWHDSLFSLEAPLPFEFSRVFEAPKDPA